MRPTLLGWIRYYGRFYRSALGQVPLALDATLVHWAQRKYKHLRGRKVRAAAWLRDVKSRQPGLFAHWAMETTVGR
ncbi:group II intron maturase-specific domain-containing protein [Cupriavidus sp. D39]|uniref:group II intron maturase-specific domain-containing protein n=1 Tax=Cupriavidus sp. D39 TaxID=2997877 RepID=UPI003B63937F